MLLIIKLLVDLRLCRCSVLIVISFLVVSAILSGVETLKYPPFHGIYFFIVIRNKP